MSNFYKDNKNAIDFLFILAFSASILLVVFINEMNAQKTLAETYGYSKSFIGKCWENQYVGPRILKKDGSNYSLGKTLTICKNSDGLYLSYSSLYSTGGPPIFAPWSEIMCEVRDKGKRVDIHFSKTPGIWLQIDKRLWDKIVNYKNS